MADDKTLQPPNAASVQAASGVLRPPRPFQEPATLASRLIPIVDRVRAIKATLGIRPYRVFLVHAQWTGPAYNGQGELLVRSEIEILPVPNVTSLDGLNQMARATGLVEEGSVMVGEISARYAEDDLMGKTNDLRDPAQPRTTKKMWEFWWEVRENRPQNPGTIIREFVPAGAPALSKDNLQWRITLTRKSVDRGRGGSTRADSP